MNTTFKPLIDQSLIDRLIKFQSIKNILEITGLSLIDFLQNITLEIPRTSIPGVGWEAGISLEGVPYWKQELESLKPTENLAVIGSLKNSFDSFAGVSAALASWSITWNPEKLKLNNNFIDLALTILKFAWAYSRNSKSEILHSFVIRELNMVGLSNKFSVNSEIFFSTASFSC